MMASSEGKGEVAALGPMCWGTHHIYRRCGKTMGLAASMSTYLDGSCDSERNAESESIFSTGRRASEKLLCKMRVIFKIELRRKLSREALREFVISVLGSDPYNKTITLTDENQ